MTQVEFDNKIAELKVQMSEDYKKVDAELLENLKLQNSIKDEIVKLEATLRDAKLEHEAIINRKKEIARKYHDAKNALILAFPKDKAKHEGISLKDAHDIRRHIISLIQHGLADMEEIDINNVNVLFKLNGEELEFDVLVPEK